VLLATVKGDVHDIGKNIVGVVLQCNNYEVIDLGVMVPCAKILETARREGVDLIGLSGLITPSLEEMSFVAQEMEREGFRIPLLIGGATTSRIHTAVKIEPHYHGPTVHVLDASRAVGVAGSLLSDTLRDGFVAETRDEYRDVRAQRSRRGPVERRQPIEDARRQRLAVDWTGVTPPVPCSTGLTVLDDYPLDDLVPRIDWTPFFQTWELAGHYPDILADATVGAAATSLFRDARVLLDRLVRERLLRARGVFGVFRANAVGDDIELYADEERTEQLAVIHTLRQQMFKPPGRPNLALADFVAPRAAGVADHVGAFAVSAGAGLDELVAGSAAEHDDYNAILAKALADRLAEAFAERLHERVRRQFWGYAPDEHLDATGLLKEQYVGIRPAPGYPASPEHTEKQTLWELLDVAENTGMELTESMAMWPGASVSGIYFSHPESQYFVIGRVGRDQVADYAERKGWTQAEAERWLSANLGYDPED
ncbi:MAG: vitamin B12 dependent-methionine synthase activation domain-containing protein, partial [Nocardioides sp.]